MDLGQIDEMQGRMWEEVGEDVEDHGNILENEIDTDSQAID